MALSKSFDSFSCPVCSETLKSPKILPCLHTFCEQCIHEFILSTCRNKDNVIKDFNCPVCRIVVKPKDAEATTDKWAAAIQDNVIMNTVLTMAHDDKSLECHACKRHEQTSEATFWCKQCYEALCEKCNSMHSWMKLSMTHDVVQIEEVGCRTLGIDLRAVSEYCPMHPLKMVDVFCFQHKTACCGLCAGINHRKCENVKPIEEIVHSSGPYKTLLEKLNDIKESTKTVLQAKEQEKVKIKEIAKNTEEDAANFIQKNRSKLDICFEAFKKQLTVFSEEQNTRLNVRIRLLEQLIKSIEHWIKVTEVVQTSGTILQLFVHVETVKQQIEASIKELQNLCSTDTNINIRFKKNDTLQKFKSVEQIGTLSIEKKEIESNQLDKVYQMCSNFGICTQKFEDIRIYHTGTMHVPGTKLQCGVCIADNYILLPGRLFFQTKTPSFG
ncbi:E3 ubiquitin-protein ligase TRIM45-like [Mytilus trossulus]|uniref:E3 ubiquitin-protein ligase TRIM45-like n=1 Tax=Mytilus trossulus TaxID=6551 RepID=UPI0030048492